MLSITLTILIRKKKHRTIFTQPFLHTTCRCLTSVMCQKPIQIWRLSRGLRHTHWLHRVVNTQQWSSEKDSGCLWGHSWLLLTTTRCFQHLVGRSSRCWTFYRSKNTSLMKRCPISNMISQSLTRHSCGENIYDII